MTILIAILIVILFYLFLIMPRIMCKPNLDYLKNHLYAHRGYHDNKSDAPENSLPSFQKAVDCGYGIELDVQLSKDNILVVFHDDDLKRVCGIDGNVIDFTYEQLQEFTLFNSNEKIPKFEEVLKIVDGKIPLIIEVKMHDNCIKACDVLMEYLKTYKGDFCIESFHPLAVLWFKDNAPNIVRGQLSDAFPKEEKISLNIASWVVEHLISNVLTRPDFIAYNHKRKNNLSRKICKNLFGSLSVAWTIKSEKEYEDAKNDFDLFIFEGFEAK